MRTSLIPDRQWFEREQPKTPSQRFPALANFQSKGERDSRKVIKSEVGEEGSNSGMTYRRKYFPRGNMYNVETNLSRTEYCTQKDLFSSYILAQLNIVI